MRIAIAIVLLLAAVGCQRSSHAPPQTAPMVTAPAPAGTIAVSPAAAVGNGIPVRPKKGSSVIAAAVGKTGPRTSQTEVRDQAGHDEIDPCAGLVDDNALDDCLAREEATAPDRAVDNGDEARIDHPEIDPRDRALMDAEEDDAVDGRQDGNEADAQDQAEDYPPDDDLPPPEVYPPDQAPDEPPPDDPYSH